MAHKDDLIAGDIDAYLKAHEKKSLLRFITCGSVDDGKSTLIGRLLYESRLIFEDQLAALEADSKKMGTQGQDIDFALLVDGLAAEREQGITIDVAYRFFSTDRRKFIVADTPGHEQYTRNMATGASTADLAILMVDARKGVLTQTRRHSFIVNMLGVKHLVLAINKMDLVNYSYERFAEIVEEYTFFAEECGVDMARVQPIPVSALKGDNITGRSENTSWYQGTTLMEHLETINITPRDLEKPFRMPVQWVNRPGPDFRGFSGLIASGQIKPGDPIKVMPSARQSVVKSIGAYDGDLPRALSGQSVTLILADEIDCSRGDIICQGDDPARMADQFETRILWMHEEPMLPGRPYILKIGARSVQATITEPKYKIDVNSLEHLATRTLELNEIGVCNISLDQDIAFDAYDDIHETGGFILIDRFTNNTVACGLINFALRRASNIHWQALEIDQGTRAEAKGQRPCVLWFTGLSGSGKSTIANALEQRLHSNERHTYLLDGDNVRHGLNKDLGFTDADRVENIRRVAEVARLMVDAGLIVLTAFISPFRSERQMARAMMGEKEFLEVWVDTPLAVAEERDPKGLYKKARAGELKNFTGIDSPYEPPLSHELRVDTTQITPDEAAEYIHNYLKANGYILA